MIRKLETTFKIAKKELRACYTKGGIIAGRHHFTDYWARDAFFASFGSLEIGDINIVKKMVETFFEHQREDGLIPYRIMRGPVSIAKYLGKPKYYKSLHPTYRLRNIGKEVLDGTTLTILFSAILGQKMWNKPKKLKKKIDLGLSYLKSHEKHSLIWDGFMAEWNDAAFKRGNLLYSNIIYWYMYDQLEKWTKKFDKRWSNKLKKKKQEIASAMRERLWNGSYFADWYDYKRQDYFYPFGNNLAIYWGLTTKEESESILKKNKEVEMKFTLETNSPKYPFWRIDLIQQLIGIGDYQNKGLLWWQPITSYLLALKKVGRTKEIEVVKRNIINKVNKDRSIHECYDRNEKPLKRLFFQAEHPFAWASGMILWALNY